MVSFKQLAQLALLGLCQMTSEAQAYEKRDLEHEDEPMDGMEVTAEYMDGMEGMNTTASMSGDYYIGNCVKNIMLY